MRNQIHVLKDYSSMECRKSSSKLFCSFCYSSVEKLLYCGKCRKRGYCSQACQREDWKSASHKFWCEKNAGEMFTDVEVRPVEGKGLGMVALRPFAKCDIVLVERPILLLLDTEMRQPSIDQIDERARAAAMALTPNDPSASFSQKFANNSMGCSDEAQSPASNRGLFLNLSRINHDCLGNTEHMYLENRGVKILVACRLIAAGEEITISYGDFRFYTDIRQAALFNRYCFWCRCSACTNTSINADLRKMTHLDDEILRVGSMGMTEIAMKKGQELLKLYDKYAMSSWHTFRTHYDMFQMAVTKRKTLPIAKSQIRQAYKDALDFCHDDTWEEVQRMKSFVEAPQSHRKYLLFG
jgi:MYND finger/SET domain